MRFLGFWKRKCVPKHFVLLIAFASRKVRLRFAESAFGSGCEIVISPSVWWLGRDLVKRGASVWAQGRHPWRKERRCLENRPSSESSYKSRRGILDSHSGPEHFRVEVGRQRGKIAKHLPCAKALHYYIISFQSHDLQITEDWNSWNWNNCAQVYTTGKGSWNWITALLKSFLFASRYFGSCTFAVSDVLNCQVPPFERLRWISKALNMGPCPYVTHNSVPYSWSCLYLYFPLQMASVFLGWGFHPTVWWCCSSS